MSEIPHSGPASARRSTAALRGALALLAICSLALPAAEKPAPPPPMKDANGVLAGTVPARIIPEPEERGKPYKVPATEWKTDPVLWGWTCELPDGTGMTFGGVHQTADDGLAHTQLKTAQGWTPIHEELRKANTLQPWFTRTRAVRGACKDALAKARHLYFEGKTTADESKLVAAEIDPAINAVAKDLVALMAGLKGLKGQQAYEAGQTAFALKHLEAAAGMIKPFAGVTTPERMAELRKGQIELEIAAEAFDAEPPPRALSKIAYEPKTKSFVIFGGWHMDYATNDLWVFEAGKKRWFQRHPATAPEPRFDAHLEPMADGSLAMRGGCTATKGYQHAGPARWIYDLAKDAWSADGHQEQSFPSDTRVGAWPPAAPETYMAGPRPDAAAITAKLKALPVNTWTRMPTPIGVKREFATSTYDPQGDMLYLFAGGHVCYSGNDMARYHLATGRWEITDPMETPLGCAGTNEQYPSGFNFNRRPWVRKHIWNGHAFDLQMRKSVVVGVTEEKIDRYFYLYDPVTADWSERLPIAEGMHSDAQNSHVRSTKHGMVQWYGNVAWLLDPTTRQWSRLAVTGTMPGTCTDGAGMCYDSKRDRMLFFTCGGYAKPYDGQIYALDFKTRSVAPLNPEGKAPDMNWNLFEGAREMIHHPPSDTVLFPARYRLNGVETDRHVVYDAGKNRWLAVRLAHEDAKVHIGGAVNFGFHWDAGRDLIWWLDAGYEGCVRAMRFDLAKADVVPLKDFVPPVKPK